MFYINMCDLSLKFRGEKLYDMFAEIRKNKNIDMLYVGSYFCGNYFNSFLLNGIDDCLYISDNYGTKIRLVIPILTQKNLEKGKKLFSKAIKKIGNRLDAVVVNDLGMLEYIYSNYSINIVLGRLFSKDTRDQRVGELDNIIELPLSIDGFYEMMKKQYLNLIGYEVENIYNNILNHEIVSIHVPYVYQTVGQICCYSNVLNKNNCFEPNIDCTLECERSLIKYKNDAYSYIRLGRAILYKTNRNVPVDADVIYLPMEEFWHENTCTIKKF